MYKEVGIESTLDQTPVIPPIDQVQRFAKKAKGDNEYDEDYGSDDEEAALRNASDAATLTEMVAQATKAAGVGAAPAVSFGKGDKAKAIRGDMTGSIGKVVAVDPLEKIVTLEMDNIIGQEIVAGKHLQFLADDLVKYILQGAHVKVAEGIYAGETGNVVMVNEAENVALVVTDLAPRQIEVRLQDLQESTEIAQGLNQLGGFMLYDLVGIEAAVAGVVVAVGREELTVLDNYGSTRAMKPAQCRGNLNRKLTQAFDSDQGVVKENSRVAVLVGPHKSQENIVKRIHKGSLFLYAKDRSENAGIVVERARDCRVVGKTMSGLVHSTNHMGKLDGSKKPGVKAGGRGAMFGDRLLGKTVRIKRGKRKGMLGIVVDATESHVKVELHAQHKVETMQKNMVVEVGDSKGKKKGYAETIESAEQPGTSWGGIGINTPGQIGQTPLHGAATPLHSSTPMHGGASPTWMASPARSDMGGAWQPGVGDTPMHSYDPFDDSKSAGGATPRHDPFANDEYDPSAAANDHIGGASPGGASPYADSHGNRSNFRSTPGSEYDPGTPGMGATPGETTPGGTFGGHGSEYDPALDASNPFNDGVDAWCDIDCELVVKATGEVCKVVGFEPSGEDVTVKMKATGARRTMRPSDLKPVPPKLNDKARTWAGDEKGKTGTMTGVDGDDGMMDVVEFGEHDYLIVQVSEVVKIADW
jgi:transcription elongation factor SPT5